MFPGEPSLMMSIGALRFAICVTLLCAAAVSDALSLGSVAFLPAAALPLAWLLLVPVRATFSTLPNVVTVVRTALPVVCVLWPVESGGARCVAGLLFVALDFVDGALARRLNQASAIGGLLDEEADAFGTLVASAELIRLGLAPRWLAIHQGCAHYLFVVLERAICPGFEWHMPFARTAAGIMGVCLVGASLAHAAGAPPWLCRSMGCASCAVNAVSFACSYACMMREVLRRRAASRAVEAAPRFVFATVGRLESTSGGYIFERLMYHGLLRGDGSAGGARGAHAAGSATSSSPPWAIASELWEMAYEHEIFGASPDASPARRAVPPLLSRREAAARFAALPRGSIVVLDGFALLQLAEAVEARPPAEVALVAFEHYPFSCECDASEATRQLCFRQERSVLSRCHRIIAAGELTRETLLRIYPSLQPSRVVVLNPPIRFAASGVEEEERRAAVSASTSATAREVPCTPSHGAPLRILLVANAIPRKNIGTVLRALAAARSCGAEHWRLTIAGSLDVDAPHAAALASTAAALGLAETHVEWRGVVDTPELALLYSGAHLFVHTALFENYCMAAQEAAFFGLPILAYDVGALRSFTAPSGRVLVPVDDEAAFTAELRCVLTQPTRLDAMRRAACDGAAALHARLRAHPSVCSTVGEFEAILEAAMHDRAAAATKTTADHTGGPRFGLALRMALLLLLYALQGLIFGFVGGALPVLVPGAAFSSLGFLSLSLLPFALKVLFAPLIDVLWLRRLGRRKSWVVPCTMLSGALLGLLALTIDAWVAAQQLEALGGALGVLVLVISAQDVAVDAWAIELLPRTKLAYASACQTIGMSAGNVLGHPLLLALSSRGASLAPFCFAVAIGHTIASVAALAMPEAVAAAKPVAFDGGAAPSLGGLWRELRAFSRDKVVRALGVVCFWQRVAVIPLDAAAAVHYMRMPGARREHLAAFTIAQAPVGLLASVLVARLLGREQSDAAAVMQTGYAMLLGCGVLAPLVLGGALAPLGTPASIPYLFVLCTVFAAANKTWWTAQGTAFNEVVTQRGSANAVALNLQLLNSLSNLGKLWPRPVVFALIEHVGFTAASALLAAVGAVAWMSVRQALTTVATCKIAARETAMVPTRSAAMSTTTGRAQRRHRSRSSSRSRSRTRLSTVSH